MAMVASQAINARGQGKTGAGDGARAGSGYGQSHPVRADLNVYFVVNCDRGVSDPADELHRGAEVVEHEGLDDTVA
jgi:hypothetical protein